MNALGSKVLGRVATKSLRATFLAIDRRVGHCIEMVRNGEFQTVLVSQEGNDSEQWPASPALQSVHVEKHNEDDVAFLVGMAGRNHWSASVKADSKLDRIVFEIACRIASEPLWLGSTYRMDDSLPNASPAELPVRIDAIAPLNFAANGTELAISIPFGNGALPRTVAWSYSVKSY